MKSRRSLDLKTTSRKKKLHKRHTLGPSQIGSDDQKENIHPITLDQGVNLACTTRSAQKRAKKNSNNLPPEWELSLQANNRELATALEDAQIQINASNREKFRLNTLLNGERQDRIESIRRQVDDRVQEKFKVIDEYLQKTVCKLLECAKLITLATEVIFRTSKPTEATNALTAANIPFHGLDTTPPPEEPEKMEVTSAEVIPMETTCVEFGSIEAVVHELSQNDYLPTTAPETSRNEDDNLLSLKQIASDQPMRRKTRRSSAGNVSYAMPSLRSKLRRGDPFTDTTFREDFGHKDPSKKKRGRMSTGCIQKKSRYALSNLTNIIKEEQEM